MFLLSAYFLTKDLAIGLCYLIFIAISFFASQLLTSNFYKGIYFVIIFFISAAYFVRPIILIDYPDCFMYDKLVTLPQKQDIAEALRDVILGFIFLSAGFILCVKSIKIVPPKLHQSNFLLSNYNIINSVIITLTCVNLMLFYLDKVGLKGSTSDTDLAFLVRLLTPDVAFLIYFLYIVKYWKRFNLLRRFFIISMILIISYSVFITGSKAFMALFFLCYFFYFIYKNLRIRLSVFLSLTAIGLVLIVFSFIAAFAVKNAGSTELSSIVQKSTKYINAKDVVAIGDDVTSRMMGMDGQLVKNALVHQNNTVVLYKLKDAFDAKELFLRYLNGLLPKITFTNSPMSGKVVSEVVLGMRADINHAGAIGFFSAIYFISANFSWLISLLIGIGFGGYFVFIRRYKDEDLSFVLYFSGCFFMMRTILSGNFDSVLAEFTIKIIMLYLYIVLINTLKYNLVPKKSYLRSSR